jgi:hypothetical protein
MWRPNFEGHYLSIKSRVELLNNWSVVCKYSESTWTGTHRKGKHLQYKFIYHYTIKNSRFIMYTIHTTPMIEEEEEAGKKRRVQKEFKTI